MSLLHKQFKITKHRCCSNLEHVQKTTQSYYMDLVISFLPFKYLNLQSKNLKGKGCAK